MPNDTRRLIDVDAGHEWLGMTKTALRGRIRRRQIPIVRIGGRIYLDPHAIEKWISQHSEPATTDSAAA